MLYQPKKWPRERILQLIRTRFSSGLSVKSEDIEEELSGLWETGCREFGTWRKVVAAADVAYPKREWSWKWPRKRILEVIQVRARKKRSLVNTSVRKEIPGLVDAARRTFDSWGMALVAAAVR